MRWYASGPNYYEGLITMIGFFIGLLVGGFFGVVIMCILSVAGDSDYDYGNLPTIIETKGEEVELIDEEKR